MNEFLRRMLVAETLGELLSLAHGALEDGVPVEKVETRLRAATSNTVRTLDQATRLVESGEGGSPVIDPGRGIRSFQRGAGEVAQQGLIPLVPGREAEETFERRSGALMDFLRGAGGFLGRAFQGRLTEEDVRGTGRVARGLLQENPLEVFGPETVATAIGPFARTARAAARGDDVAEAIARNAARRAAAARRAEEATETLIHPSLSQNVLESTEQFGGATFNPRTGETLAGEDVWAVTAEKLVEPQIVRGRPITQADIDEYLNRPEVRKALEEDPSLTVATWNDTAGDVHGGTEINLTKTFPGAQQDEAVQFAVDQDRFSILNLAHPEFKAVPVPSARAAERGIPEDVARQRLQRYREELDTLVPRFKREGFTRDPSEFLRRQDFPVPEFVDEDPAMYHVTTAMDKVRSEGLKSRTQTGRVGLGGGAEDVAPDMVSVTFDSGRAAMIEERLRLGVRAARGESSLDEVLAHFDSLIGDPEPRTLAQALDAPDEVADDWIGFTKWVTETFDEPYELLQQLDEGVLDVFKFSDDPAVFTVGLTASREDMARVDLDQIGTVQVEAKQGAQGTLIPEEMEIRFRPEDIRIAEAPEVTAAIGRVAPLETATVDPEALQTVEALRERGQRFLPAFLDELTGRAIPTGPAHDPLAITDLVLRRRLLGQTDTDPAGFFDTQTGRFLTREETARATGAARGEASLVSGAEFGDDELFQQGAAGLFNLADDPRTRLGILAGAGFGTAALAGGQGGG